MLSLLICIILVVQVLSLARMEKVFSQRSNGYNTPANRGTRSFNAPPNHGLPNPATPQVVPSLVHPSNFQYSSPQESQSNTFPNISPANHQQSGNGEEFVNPIALNFE